MTLFKNQWVQQVLSFAGLALAGLALLSALWWFGRSITDRAEAWLPVLAIAGVLILLLALALISAAFAAANLSDKTQALGLPEGSIRAVIALSLIVVFAILSVYLFSDLSNGRLQAVGNLTKEQANSLFDKVPPLQRVSGPVNTGTSDKPSYSVSFQTVPNAAGIDFAKQLLVLVGTLVTAVSSFYFGSRAAATAAGATGTTSDPPAIRSIVPTVIKAGGGPQEFTLNGDNLAALKEVKAVSKDQQVLASDVTSSGSVAKFKLAGSGTTDQKWDIVVTDSSGRQATLSNSLTTQQ